jgi:glycosyltransferase involved in cell wall biosynthesis
MLKVNLHVFLSDFKHESRVLRETKGIAESGLFGKIVIAALWDSSVKEVEEIENNRVIWRVRLKTRILSKDLLTQVMKYIEWIGNIFFRFRKDNIACVNCHGLSALPVGLIFKVFNKSKIIYDTHELETESNGLAGIRKTLAKLLEGLLIRYSDSVIVVSSSIAEWYERKYSIKNVYVIRNIPDGLGYGVETPVSNILKDKFRIKKSEMLFIYQGGLANGRGICMMLDTFAKVTKDKHIVFMGKGVLERLIKNYSCEFTNIHFLNAVNPEEVLRYTSSADIGISLIENVCLSYYYSLPNKVFEYLLSGLPVIVSDFPEMGRFIDENKCGWKVNVDPTALFDLVKNISNAELIEKKEGAMKCKNKFTWHKEKEVLLKIYEDLTSQRNIGPTT